MQARWHKIDIDVFLKGNTLSIHKNNILAFVIRRQRSRLQHRKTTLGEREQPGEEISCQESKFSKRTGIIHVLQCPSKIPVQGTNLSTGFQFVAQEVDDGEVRDDQLKRVCRHTSMGTANGRCGKGVRSF